MNLDYEKLTSLTDAITEYSKQLKASDQVRVAAYVASLVDAIQQSCVPDVLNGFGAFDDKSPLGFQIHNDLETMIDDFDSIADAMDEEAEKETLRATALEKLTVAERAALGV